MPERTFRPRSHARALLAATALAACHPTPSALAPASSAPTAATAPPPSAAPSASPVADGGWQEPLLADHPLVGRIYRPGTRAFATRAELEAALAGARYVLLGEKHDNRDHHRLQAELVTGLARLGRVRAVAFEMIDVSAQPVVDELLAGSATSPPDVDALAAALRWDASGWPAWSMYRPVFAAALGARARLVAANLSRTDAMAVARARREGKDPATAVSPPLPPLPALSAGAQAALEDELRASHCGALPEASLPGMMLAQRARDATLAARVREAAGTGEAGAVVLIAGAGHVRADRGVPAALGAAELGPAAAVAEPALVTVAFVEVVRGELDPVSYLEAPPPRPEREPFDFLWFTPRVDEDDPCAGMHGGG